MRVLDSGQAAVMFQKARPAGGAIAPAVLNVRGSFGAGAPVTPEA
jgi:hypothetical protein